eukprot:8965390-Pyramimonas_sp.AAC.1
MEAESGDDAGDEGGGTMEKRAMRNMGRKMRIRPTMETKSFAGEERRREYPIALAQRRPRAEEGFQCLRGHVSLGGMRHAHRGLARPCSGGDAKI